MPATTSPADDILARYLAELGQHPRLSYSDEIRLARAIERGDEAAKRRLVEANLRLVVSLARRHGGLGLELTDLIQEGNLGLLDAAERYDWRRGVRFSTFAGWWIRRSIHMALTSRSRTIRLPRRIAESGTRVKRAEARLAQRLGRAASASEVAREAGVGLDTVAQLRRAEMALVPLDEPGVEDGDVLEERLRDEAAADPADTVVDLDGERILRAALADLAPRSRRVLELRYGLGDDLPRTLAEIADELGVSRTRVQHIERVAMRTLAAHPELQPLREAA